MYKNGCAENIKYAIFKRNVSKYINYDENIHFSL